MGADEAYIRNLVSEYARVLRKQVRVERIILFGSRARGDADPGSDIDLLVVSPDFGENVLFDMDVLRGCLPPHTEGIDTIGCTPADVAAAEPGEIIYEASSEGIVVFQAGSAPITTVLEAPISRRNRGKRSGPEV